MKDNTTSIMGALSTSPNKIGRVSVNKEDERSVSVSVTFQGFDDKTTTYKIRAFILNKNKESIAAISPVEADMPRSKQVDMSFLLGDESKTTNSPILESAFLRIKVSSSGMGNVVNILEDAVSGLSLSQHDYLYEFPKKWMRTGPNVVLTVKLTPYKNALTISQN